MSSIFLSHSSKDGPASERIKEWLATQGHNDVFLDFDPEDGIPPGRNWERELYQQLRACRAVIVLCSEHSMRSKWCFVEMTHARSLGKHIFPIKIGECEIESLLQDLQIVDLTRDPDEAFERLGRALKAAGVDAADPLDWDASRPPYPGLLSFQEEDAAVFFGRDQETGQGLDLLNQMRRYGGAGLLLLLGSSGSGKSSLMRAGMLPRLRRAEDQWLIVDPFRPGDDPLGNLAAALAQAGGDETAPDWRSIRDRLTAVAGSDDPGGALVEIARGLPRDTGRKDATVLLFIDQFEELLGHKADHPGHLFLSMLHSALVPPRAPLLAVATLRSDFLGTFQKHVVLRKLPFRDLSLPPVPQERRIEIIKRPAEKAGIDLDDTLVQALLEDTEAEDALPLLAFTLRELWELWRAARAAPDPSGERRPDRPIELGDYRERLGGLKGSVARAAKGVLDSRPFRAGEEESLRGAFLGMVRVDQEGHFARRAIGWSKLSEQAHEWLERFVDARLLAARGEKREDGTLEVAHEALFEAWDQLAAWLDESREALLLQHELGQAASLWDRGGRSDDDLWKGGRLHRALEVRDLAFDRRRATSGQAAVYAGAERRQPGAGSGGRLPVAAVDLDFLAASEAAEERARRRRRRRRMAILGGSLAVAAVSFSLFLWALWERRQTEIQASRVLAQQAYTLRDRLDLALLLTVEASRVQESLESRTSLLSLLGPYPRLRTILDQQEGRIHEVAISPQGGHLAAAGDDGVLRVFDLATGGFRDLATGQRTFALAFSPDGAKLASAGTDDGATRLWDVRDGALLQTLDIGDCPEFERREGGWDTVYAVAFDPTRRRLATTNGEGLVRLWDEASGACLYQERGHFDSGNTLAYRPDGRWLASGSSDGSVLVWDLSDGLVARERLESAHRSRVLSLAASPDGGTLASGGRDGKIRLWDFPPAGAPPRHDLAPEGAEPVESVMFAGDGSMLASGGQDGLVRLWDPATGEPLFTLPGHPPPVTGVALGPEGLLGSSGGDGQVRLWDAGATGAAGLAITGHTERIRAVVFDPTGRTAASGGDDGSVRVWDLATGAERFAFLPPEAGTATATASAAQPWGDVIAIAYRSDGNRLAAGDTNGNVRLWDPESGEERWLPHVPSPGVSWLAFSPDGRRLAVGCAAAHLWLWDLAGDALPLRLQPVDVPPGQDRVRSLAFTPDGQRLAAGVGPTVQHWDLAACAGGLAGCKPTAQRYLAEDPRTEFLALAFDPAGRTLVGGAATGPISRWRLDAGELRPLAGLPGHEAATRTFLFAPGDRYLVSGGGDRLIRLWDLASDDLVFELRGHGDDVDSLVLVGDRLLSASHDRTIRSWDFAGFDDLEALERRACDIANRDLTRAEWDQFIGPNKTYRPTCGRKWAGLGRVAAGAQGAPR